MTGTSLTGSPEEERLRQLALDEIDGLTERLDRRIFEIEESGLLRGLNEFHAARQSARQLRNLAAASRSPHELTAIVDTLRWLCENADAADNAN